MSLTTSTQRVTSQSVAQSAPAVRVVDLTAPDVLDARSGLDRLRTPILQNLDDGPCIVLVDVTHVRQVAASGLTGALELLHLTRRHGGDLRFYGSSPALQQARSETGLHAIVCNYLTRDQALTCSAERRAPLPPHRRSRIARLLRRR